jgi:hypothetical protein
VNQPLMRVAQKAFLRWPEPAIQGTVLVRTCSWSSAALRSGVASGAATWLLQEPNAF